MAITRNLLLTAAKNRWLRQRAARYQFVRRSVSRFMPGESLEDALRAAQSLHSRQIGTVLTHLGENVKDAAEAETVTKHYVEVLQRIRELNLDCEISVKLTQLGLDLSKDLCYRNLRTIIEREQPNRVVWIDMESSEYVTSTLEIYRRVLESFPDTGICLQAYLYRTAADVRDLLPVNPSIRLVKGAYNEHPKIAYPKKQDVDNNYFELATQLLNAQRSDFCRRIAFATHDLPLIDRIRNLARDSGMPKSQLEIQMLYGIQTSAQDRLAREGCRSMVLVAYGDYWYPWFMRRLAERPANLWFLLKNIF